MSSYLIEYIGCCGQEASTHYQGEITGLLKEITWIEERGGWGVSAIDEDTDEVVYEDGSLCQDCMM